MKYFPILSPQNIHINFELASTGQRILAFLIDWVVKILYLWAISFTGLERALEFSFDDQWSMMALSFFIYAPVMFYTLFSEYYFEGKTLGKSLLKIRVLSTDSYTNSFEQYFIRWIFRIVDFYLGFGLIGVLSSVFSKNNQRLGDFASSSVVVSLNNKTNLQDTFFQEVQSNHQITFPSVTLLSDRDMQIIKQVYENAKKNQDYKVIKKLRTKIDGIVKIKSKMNDYDFIETIITDYNFMTKDLT